MKFKVYLWLISVLPLIIACQRQAPTSKPSSIEILEHFEGLQTIIDANHNKLLLVNFWATSCPPCIKEMPHFNRLEQEYSNKNLKILLVSLDRIKDLDSRVYPFVSKYEILPEVAILQDQNYSAWTAKIDTSWYGALPATILLKGEQKKFRFGAYEDYEDLEKDVKELMR